MGRKDWVTIAIPRELYSAILNVIGENYISPSEFIRAAIREKLKEEKLTKITQEVRHFEGEVIEE